MFKETLVQWVKTAPADDFWFIAIIAIVFSIAGFIGAFYFFYRKRIIEDTPTSKIRSAAQGYVEFNGHGHLMEGAPITARLTGKSCTWYKYNIEEYRRSGKNSRWVTVDCGTSEELFLIRDETGECIIDPEGAHVTTDIKDVWYGNSRHGSNVGASSIVFLGSIGRRYRYTEYRMRPGGTLYAIGLYKTVGGASAKLAVNEDVRELIREWKTDSSRLLAVFDQNKDGEIDMEEWQAVRDEAYKLVMANHKDLQTQPAVNIMSKTLDKRRPYLLSAIPQSTLIKRFNYYAMSLIILFFLSGSLATLMINIRTGN